MPMRLIKTKLVHAVSLTATNSAKLMQVVVSPKLFRWQLLIQMHASRPRSAPNVGGRMLAHMLRSSPRPPHPQCRWHRQWGPGATRAALCHVSGARAVAPPFPQMLMSRKPQIYKTTPGMIRHFFPTVSSPQTYCTRPYIGRDLPWEYP